MPDTATGEALDWMAELTGMGATARYGTFYQPPKPPEPKKPNETDEDLLKRLIYVAGETKSLGERIQQVGLDAVAKEYGLRRRTDGK